MGFRNATTPDDYHCGWYAARLHSWAAPLLRPAQAAALKYVEGRAKLNLLVGQIATLPQHPPRELAQYHLDAIELLENPERPTFRRCGICNDRHPRRHHYCATCAAARRRYP